MGDNIDVNNNVGGVNDISDTDGASDDASDADSDASMGPFASGECLLREEGLEEDKEEEEDGDGEARGVPVAQERPRDDIGRVDHPMDVFDDVLNRDNGQMGDRELLDLLAVEVEERMCLICLEDGESFGHLHLPSSPEITRYNHEDLGVVCASCNKYVMCNGCYDNYKNSAEEKDEDLRCVNCRAMWSLNANVFPCPLSICHTEDCYHTEEDVNCKSYKVCNCECCDAETICECFNGQRGWLFTGMICVDWYHKKCECSVCSCPRCWVDRRKVDCQCRKCHLFFKSITKSANDVREEGFNEGITIYLIHYNIMKYLVERDDANIKPWLHLTLEFDDISRDTYGNAFYDRPWAQVFRLWTHYYMDRFSPDIFHWVMTFQGYVNVVNWMEITPLEKTGCELLVEHRYFDFLRDLIEKKPEIIINRCSRKGQTLLSVLIKHDHFDLVEFLCKKGARIDWDNTSCNDEKGRILCLVQRPIKDAIEKGNLRIIDLLMKYGAKVTQSERDAIAVLKGGRTLRSGKTYV